MNRTALRTAALLMGALAIAALSGCAAAYDPDEPVTSPLVTYTVPLGTGQSVECVGSKYTGSVIEPDCNWSNLVSTTGSEESGTLTAYKVSTSTGGDVLCVGSKYTGSVIQPDCNWPENR